MPAGKDNASGQTSTNLDIDKMKLGFSVVKNSLQARETVDAKTGLQGTTKLIHRN